MMMTRPNDEGRHPDYGIAASNRTHDDDTDQSTAPPRDHATALANFERLAARAAADPAFYEVAGGNVQHHADQVRVGRWTA